MLFIHLGRCLFLNRLSPYKIRISYIINYNKIAVVVGLAQTKVVYGIIKKIKKIWIRKKLTMVSVNRQLAQRQ